MNTIISSSITMIIWRIATISVGILTTIVLARWLGPADRGALAVIVVSISLAALLVQFGMPEASIYAIGKSDLSSKSGVISAFMVLATVLSSGLACAVIVAAWLTDWLNGFDVLGVAGVAALVVLGTFLRHILLGLGAFRAYNASGFAEAVTYLSVASLTWWDIKHPSLYAAFTAYTVSVMVGVGVTIVLCIRVSRIQRLRATGPNLSIIFRSFRSASHLFIAGLGGFLTQRLAIFGLEWREGTESVGRYVVAGSVPAMFSNLPQQFATVMYSYVSKSDKPKSTLNEVGDVFGTIMTAFFVIFLLMLAMVGPIVRLLFGSEFESVAPTMIVLMLSAIFSGASTILFNALAGNGKADHAKIMVLLGTGLVVIILIPAIDLFGIMGAAIAQLFGVLASLWYIQNKFTSEINISTRILWKPRISKLKIK